MKKKHIAVILSGIFIFPILFLSFHTVLHHQYEPACEHRCCHKEDASTMAENFVEDHTSCLVCDYEFSINHLPDITTFRSITPFLEYSYQEKGIQAHIQEVYSYKSPRAPPFLLL